MQERNIMESKLIPISVVARFPEGKAESEKIIPIPIKFRIIYEDGSRFVVQVAKSSADNRSFTAIYYRCASIQGEYMKTYNLIYRKDTCQCFYNFKKV